jgi:hypothetical protein
LHNAASRYVLLALILVVLAGLKLAYNPFPVGDYGRDGAIYYEIADQFAEGQGLTTRLSDIGQGVSELPHASPWYPVWPFLLGSTGKLIGLQRAAALVPEFFYIVALVLFYFLMNAVVANPVVWPRLPVDVGHLAILIFGLNPIFFTYTSLPFTEGLAFSLMFATSLVLIRAMETERESLFLLVGVLTGLSYLARSQNALMMGFVPLLPFTVMLWRRQYERAFRFSALVAMPCVLLTLLWGAYLYRNFESFSPAVMVDTTAVHETPEVEQLQIVAKTDSLLGLIKDRLKGVRVAFNPSSEYSYFSSFGRSVYFIPLALLYLLSNRKVQSVKWNRFLAVIAVAIGPVITVHLMHKAIWGDWNFQFRHGLPIIFAIGLSLALLLSRESFVRALTLVIFSVSLLSNVRDIGAQMDKKYLPPSGAKLDLVRWIDDQPAATFVTTRAWDLSALTRARFHAAYCNSSPDQLAVYAKIRVTDVIVLEGDRECRLYEKLNVYADRRAQFETIEVWHLNTDITAVHDTQ